MLPVLFQWEDIIIFSYPLFMGIAWGVAYKTSKLLLRKYQENINGFFFLFWGSFFLVI